MSESEAKCPCETCGGTKYIQQTGGIDYITGKGTMINLPCPDCHGSGEQAEPKPEVKTGEGLLESKIPYCMECGKDSNVKYTEEDLSEAKQSIIAEAIKELLVSLDGIDDYRYEEKYYNSLVDTLKKADWAVDDTIQIIKRHRAISEVKQILERIGGLK